MTNIAAVCATYHLEEIERMITIATSQAEDLGYNIVNIIRVPGCMEIPLALDRILADEALKELFVSESSRREKLIMGLLWAKVLSKRFLNCNWFTTNQSGWASSVLVHFQNMLDHA